MGPALVIIFWAILLTPLGLFLGLVLMFSGTSILYFFHSTPKEKRLSGWAKFGFSFLFTMAFVPVMCIFGIYMMEKDTNNYWESEGAWYYWRMPIEEPYELVMIDTMDNASIGKWKDGSAIVADIIEYEKRGPILAGRCRDRRLDSNTNTEHWFLFDCTTGRADEYVDKETFETACRQKGLCLPLAMKSIQDNWDQYWRDPNRRKD
jgi:hypothetical protein